MSSPISMADAVRQAILYQIGNIHTALPAEIIDYDYSKQKANVQPLLNKVWADGTTTPMPVLTNVPVIFPRAGGASLTFPVVSGDTCLLLFIERSTDLWRTVGGQVNPDDPRQYDLSDAVAIMGLFPFSETSQSQNNSDLLLTYKDSEIKIKKDGSIAIKTSNRIAIGNSTAEVLNIIERFLNILTTSVTTPVGASIQQTPLPPNGDTYTILKTLITDLKGTF